MKKHYLIKILTCGAIILSLSLSLAYAASDADKAKPSESTFIGGIAESVVGFVAGIIISFIASIGSLFVSLAGFLVNWALNLNAQVLDSAIVNTGWVIARDLANLGFVLVIILISFATILRIQTYEAKKLLTRLIIAALLVNFSLVIAGVFIDFSGMLTNFFIDKVPGDASQFTEQLAQGLGINKFQDVRDEAEERIKGVRENNLNAILYFIASVFFVAVFTITAAIVLLGLAAMFFIRYIVLNILLILTPLAWLFWIWPDLSHLWTDWWKTFLKWTFFAPAASFFIYLAFALIDSPEKRAGLALGGNANNALDFGMKNPGDVIGQMIAVIGILTGGLIAAEKMGIAGAAAGLAVAGKARNMVLGAPIAGAGAVGRRLRDFGYKPGGIDPATGKPIAGGSWAQRQMAKLTGIPGVGGLARTAYQQLGVGREAAKEKYSKELTELSKDKTLFMTEGGNKARMKNPVYAAQYAKMAAEKGYIKDLKEFNPDALGAGIQAARSQGIANEIYQKDPSLAKMGRDLTKPEEREAARKDMERAMNQMSAEDVLKIPPETFHENIEMMGNLTPNHIAALAKNKSRAQKETISAAADQWLDAMENPNTIHKDKLEQWNALSEESKTGYRKGIEDSQRLKHENLAWQVQGSERPTKSALPPRPRIIPVTKYTPVR